MLFVVEGELTLTIAGADARLQPGGYAFLPPASAWKLRNDTEAPVRFHWIRKRL